MFPWSIHWPALTSTQIMYVQKASLGSRGRVMLLMPGSMPGAMSLSISTAPLVPGPA